MLRFSMDNAILNKLMNLLISLARDVVPPLVLLRVFLIRPPFLFERHIRPAHPLSFTYTRPWIPDSRSLRPV